MEDKLIIYLHAHDLTRPSFVIFSKEGVAETVVHGDAERLADLCRDKDVIVIVPASDVVLMSALLPKMNRAKLLKALPFALEDHLVDDVETLHFATTEQPVDGRFPVAIVAREKIETWLSLLKSWGVTPYCMTPSTLALRRQESAWTIAADDTAAVRLNGYQGFAADLSTLSSMLNLAMVEGNAVPSSIRLLNASSAEISLRVTAQLNEEKMSQSQLYEMIAREFDVLDTINLLQGAYLIKRRYLIPPK